MSKDQWLLICAIPGGVGVTADTCEAAGVQFDAFLRGFGARHASEEKHVEVPIEEKGGENAKGARAEAERGKQKQAVLRQ